MSDSNTSGEARLGPNSPEIIEFATRMYNAARHGSLPTFQQALSAGLPPNMTNDKGDSLLMLATYHGHYDVSKLLLQHGADPNVLNDKGQSPLAGAVFKKEHDIVDLLLEWGGNPDIGSPSAAEVVGIFKMEGDWGDKFDRVRKSLKEHAEDGATAKDTSRGTKAATQLK
ncbi:MAG: hypothetical protein Q9217_004142 [Psora testacea]